MVVPVSLTRKEVEALDPYGTYVDAYWNAGWRGVLPLPPQSKGSPPEGYTGNHGLWPSYPDTYAWRELVKGANIALRLPPDVVGVDVDAYFPKHGGQTLSDLEARLGHLPPTWLVTSRDDGISGIRLFRVPVGLRWPGIFGSGIESIRMGHRYAVVAPSIHPTTGVAYHWQRPDGTLADTQEVPNVGEIPDMPDAWVMHFTGGVMADDMAHANLDDDGITGWLSQFEPTDVPCRHLADALAHALADLPDKGSRHEAALAATNRLVWLAGEGHLGVINALSTYHAAFDASFGADDRSTDGEWGRMIDGAVRMAAAAHEIVDDKDPCSDPIAAQLGGLLTPEAIASAGSAQASFQSPYEPFQAQPADAAPLSPSATAQDVSDPTEPSAAELDPDGDHVTSWWPRDVEAYLSNASPEPPPAQLHRTDGSALFYLCRVNGIIGESESGKSWLALEAVFQAVRAGQHVTYLDFEDSEQGVRNRLKALGLTDAEQRRVAYINPDEFFHPSLPTGRDLFAHLSEWRPALVIFDGFNASMTIQGLELNSNKDATQFAQVLLKPMAAMGPAVVYVDHTSKQGSHDDDSHGAIGAQAKRAMTTGCCIKVTVVDQFGKGKIGKLKIKVDKDRQGDVRGLSTKDGYIGNAVLTSDPDTLAVRIAIYPPSESALNDDPEAKALDHALNLKQAVLSFLGTCPEGASVRDIRDTVKGRAEDIGDAIVALRDDGFIGEHPFAKRKGRALLVATSKPFHRPTSDDLDGILSSPPWDTASGSNGSNTVPAVPGTASIGVADDTVPATPSPLGVGDRIDATDDEPKTSPKIISTVPDEVRARLMAIMGGTEFVDKTTGVMYQNVNGEPVPFPDGTP